MNVDDEWEMFLENPNAFVDDKQEDMSKEEDINKSVDRAICDDLNISTNTKVVYINNEVDIYNVFWKLPVIPYHSKQNGIVKKQIKVVCNTKEEFEDYKQRIKNEKFYDEYIIKQIDNPDARRIKFKDERKLTVGISKKDLITTKIKQKSAFYNCFAITIRIFTTTYKEMHIKVFNTGKMEIPGIVDKTLLSIVKTELLQHLKKYIGDDIDFVNTDIEHNVLINSNFNCGFYINRDKLHNIMKSSKYGLETSYDPCSYPGVKCKYYYNIDKPWEEQNGKIARIDNNMTTNDIILSNKYLEISFMIFRTGSCLIVGNCNEEVLRFVYTYIVNMLFSEHRDICIQNKEKFVKIKNEKKKKKKIIVDYNYYNDTILKYTT
tara:strand:+ start:4996 stop:6126 length:1131 start_codon:yes stop_codon:yes gene_type:complete